MSDLYKSHLVEHVISSVRDFNLLNAKNLEESNVVFQTNLLENLPPTNQLKVKTNILEGKGAIVYEAGTNEHPFILKKYSLSAIEGGNNFDEKMAIINDEYKRTIEYFGEYMPPTLLFSRVDENGDQEILVAQDIVAGPQLKDLMENHRSLDKPLTTEMRLEVQQILLSCIRMYEETGYVLDFDLIFDYENNTVQIFDFGSQGKTHYWNSDAMNKLKEMDVQIPSDLDLGSIDLT